MNNKDQKLCMGCMQPLENSICPFCGYDNNTPPDPNYLPPGTWLDDRYLIGAIDSRNGEGATYVGYDSEKKRPVWIREYFPLTIASRNPDTLEILPNNGRGAQYKALLSDFVELCNEIRRLSVSDPVIPVENMLGSNNTIYVIYKYLDVITLEEYINAHGGNLSPEEACDILVPLANGIDNIHRRGIIHRGLSPYTVLVDPNGKIYLDAFCLSAARTGGSELQAELYNGYSAPEQYTSTGWQGNWTDIYALGAIFYRTLSGIVPPKSTRIGNANPLAPLKNILPGVPGRISDAVEHAMEPSAQGRTQTASAFLSELVAVAGIPHTAVFDPGKLVVSLSENPDSQDFSGDTEDFSSPRKIENLRAELRGQAPKEQTDEFYDYPDEEPRKSKSGFWILLLAVIIVILIGIILAIVINDKLGLGQDKNPRPSSPASVSVSESEPESSVSQTGLPVVDGKVEVPDFVGRKLSTVEYHKDYQNVFHFTIQEAYSDKWEEGFIAEQSPPQGSSVPVGGTVVLTVSKGAHTMEMPDLTGKEYEEALQILTRQAQEMDLTIEDLTIRKVERFQMGAKENVIVSTMPFAGDKFDPEKDTIELHVAVEPPVASSVEVPSSSSKPSSSSQSSVHNNGNSIDVAPNPPGVGR